MNASRWNRRGGRFEIERQYLAYQVRRILKTKKLSEVEIEALRQKVRTSQEIVEVLIENDPAEGSVSYIKIMILRE